MKKLISSLFLIPYSLFVSAQADYAKYVNPFIGTGGHGHTYPGATTPFGMVQLSPDTRIDGSWDGCGGYHYSDSIIYGFSHTHLSGTGCSDYGDIMLMPITGEPSLDNKIYSSKFSHADETASAGYYSVKIDKGDVLVELSSTTRVGMHRYTFAKAGDVSVVLDLTHRDKLLEGKIHAVNATTFEGLRRSEAWAKDQWVFYRIEFSKPVTYSFIDKKGGNDQKAWFKFNLKKNEKLLVKVSLSSVSEEGAKKNMETELPHWDFDKVKKEARDAWQKELSKIEVSGGTEEQFKIFYTALYHTMVQPNIYNDADGQYRGRDLKVHKAEGFNYYTVFSLWDTFRAWHPLMTIIDRKRTLDYIKTFLTQYEQGGLLPVWELSSNETECMIGYHSVSVIADAAIKGINGFNMEEAFEAMKKSADSKVRYGLGAYMEKGCLSVEDESNSVSKTLEYAYDDWCIAQMAQLLHHDKDYERYMERSQSWKNLFNQETGFMRPKKNGGWLKPFDPFEVNNNYTEANAFQYSFFVPQEIAGYGKAIGGDQDFEKKLDELFAAESKTTGRDQADITGMIGQYAHGNEPSHHMAYLYNYIGKPWKTQERVRKILTEFYHAAPDGLIGNEDCGQMSAWYVMSAMGLYQVCPGYPAFDIVPPLFPEIKLNLESGKKLMIKVNGENNSYSYIRNIQFKKDPAYPNTIIPYEMVMAGGNLNYFLESDPLKTSEDKNLQSHYAGMNSSFLYSIIENPVITASDLKFHDSILVSVTPYAKDDQLYYSVSGAGYDTSFKIYAGPFCIDASSRIKVFSKSKTELKSKMVTANFYKNPHPGWKMNLVSKYSNQYTAGGDEGLIDGIRGDVDWQKGNWQGYQNDFECVIDLGKEQNIGSFSAGFLQDVRAWILMPKKAEFSFSTDGINYSDQTMIRNTVHDSDYTTQTKDFRTMLIRPVNARYVKVKAENYGKLPEWHAGAGGQAWIFIDEISVQ